MNENVEKAKVVVEQGKAVAMDKLNKLSEKADAIPFLRGNKTRKLIALGAVIVVAVLVLSMVFKKGDGKTGVMSPENARAVGNVSAEDRKDAEVLNAACKAFLEEKVGKDGLKSYEFSELRWNEGRAILKADVYIKTEPSIVNPADEGMDVRGTVVFFLEADGDDVNVVDMEIR